MGGSDYGLWLNYYFCDKKYLFVFDNKNGHGGGRTLDRCVISTTL